MQYYAAVGEDGLALAVFRRRDHVAPLERWQPKSGAWLVLEEDLPSRGLSFVHPRDFTRVRTEVLRSAYGPKPGIGPEA